MKEGMVYEPHIGMLTSKSLGRKLLTNLPSDHCLESLRQYVMCKADATILTWYWPDEPPRESGKYYPQTDYRFQQQCVNWEKLRAWEVSNSFQLSPETIFHPIYGMNIVQSC
jgi:Mycotoxin biosynthesis protein UstYa